MPLRKPEFPLFPHGLWRPNPSFLASGNLPPNAVDPWARRDDWRYHKFFSARNRLKAAFPGLLYGVVAVGMYILYDQWYQNSGPGAIDAKEWKEWLAKRNKEKGIGHHEHHEEH